MVKKTYVAPNLKEARTKLRTGLLAGSNPGSVTETGGSVDVRPGGTIDPTQPGSPSFGQARSRASLD